MQVIVFMNGILYPTSVLVVWGFFLMLPNSISESFSAFLFPLLYNVDSVFKKYYSNSLTIS